MFLVFSNFCLPMVLCYFNILPILCWVIGKFNDKNNVFNEAGTFQMLNTSQRSDTLMRNIVNLENLISISSVETFIF